MKNEEDASAKSAKHPMSDAEFHHFLDGVGVIIRHQEFRLCVYQGGIDQSLRRVVWRHLLNIYPEGMTGKERFDYLKRKSSEYYKLRDEWKVQFSQGKGSDEVKYVTNMVKKDVLRTDRTHSFYAGDDDNSNVLSLFNVLVTYALTHPTVSYCQGMSDIASPLLVIQKDEAHTYACLCGLMARLKSNFLLEGEVMNTKFQHLSLLLQHHDLEFYHYLKYHNAEDLFFCYRWLLLELKREFPFEDALLMLETMWSSLPPNPPLNELPLTEPNFKLESLHYMSPSSPAATNLSHGSNAYMRLMSQRRHTPSPISSLATSRFNSPCNNKSPILNKTPSGSVQNDGSTDEKSQCNSNGVATQASPSGEISTPVDEDPRSYPSLQDMLPRSLLDKCSSIEKSLEHVSLHDSPPSGEEENCVTQNNGHTTLSSPDEKVSQSSSPGDETKANQMIDTSTVDSVTTSQQDDLKSIPDISVNSQDISPDSLSETEMTKAPVIDKTAHISNLSLDNTNTNNSQSQNTSLDTLDNNTFSPPTSPKRPSDIPLKEVTALNVRNSIPANEVKSALVRNGQGVLVERTMQTSNISSCEEAKEPLSIEFVKVNEKLARLPPPQEFGCGNPFLMFLSLTLLLQHRDHIMRNRMDYNELAMHFDKMVRKHNVQKVLQQAKSLYAIYLRNQAVMDNEDEKNKKKLNV